MSRFEARWAPFLTLSLLAFSLPTNGVPTNLSTSITTASPSTINSALATALSQASVASVHATACPADVAAIASAVTNVVCTTSSSQFSIPGFTYPPCATYTSYIFPTGVYPPASCCNTCSIQATQVTVNFWSPEATPAPAETPYTLVSDGYTFTSPSVYVAFKGLYAQGDCTDYEQGQIGTTIADATIAYDPAALQTAACQIPAEEEFLGYYAINYTDWANPVPNSVVETRVGCFIPNTSGIDPAATDLDANPAFSLPQGLSSLQPIWSSYGCQPNGRVPAYTAIPNVLTKTSAAATGVQKRAVETETAVPAGQLTSPIVAPTGI